MEEYQPLENDGTVVCIALVATKARLFSRSLAVTCGLTLRLN